MITVVDYGVGNLFSLASSFRYIGEQIKVSSDPDVLRKADKLVLPGVGAFKDASEKLFKSGLAEAVVERANAGVPLMGICLGMQLLFDSSAEFGVTCGLSLIHGSVEPIENVIDKNLKIPHIGWNALLLSEPRHPIFKYLKSGDCAYFVHSYYAVPENKDAVIAKTEYGALLTAAVADGNVCGCQFHPEKSGAAGLSILKAFAEI